MTGYYEPLSYVVPPAEDGIMLKTILHDRMKLSRKLLSRLKLTAEGITVNGERRYTTSRVRSGDVVEIRMQEEESDDILPQDIPIDILHEDDQLLIVNKAAGMIVHPTHGHYMNTIANAVVFHWRQAGRKVRFRPVHRLDRETSGVLAIAKTPYAHQHISAQMQANGVDKTYVAIVHGRVREDSGTVDEPIDRDPASPHVRIVTPSGYPSVTHYEVLERLGEAATFVRLRLETGRTHQIRVHMNHIGHPLLGDAMYGVSPEREKTVAGEPLDRHALHAARLAFAHPADGRPVAFEAPLPDDMARWLDLLRRGGSGSGGYLE
ncbi:RluA family pseudouridine synthase [Paenibacillus flagellatus]|uniref:Pseudouridine synthase n=1 Tax=Paenibacillus flagellatus TaxID=2211139 RepID=A0A2V5KGJ9_9BACL|nr:RluA family pseudouridine synthase [Paenibacillus flagellatus]PYI57503.1 RluA family pseudouridine synthase [Paenibacillus flagellatus]